MATFVVAHGAWSVGWAWRKMRPLMQAAGHTLITPAHTGLGERAHLAHAGIDLDAHIKTRVAQPDAATEDRIWADPRRIPQPIKAFETSSASRTGR